MEEAAEHVLTCVGPGVRTIGDRHVKIQRMASTMLKLDSWVDTEYYTDNTHFVVEAEKIFEKDLGRKRLQQKGMYLSLRLKKHPKSTRVFATKIKFSE